MRRGPGIGGMQRKMAAQKRYENLGNEIEALTISNMQKQLDTFQVKLEEFATKHKEKINKNPLFRAQFQKMCASIGVDPLASNKGMWAQSLNIGDFYYEVRYTSKYTSSFASELTEMTHINVSFIIVLFIFVIVGHSNHRSMFAYSSSKWWYVFIKRSCNHVEKQTNSQI